MSWSRVRRGRLASRRTLGLALAATALLAIPQPSGAKSAEAPAIDDSANASTGALRIDRVVPDWQGDAATPWRLRELACGSPTSCAALTGPVAFPNPTAMSIAITDDAWETFELLPLSPEKSQWARLECHTAMQCTAVSFDPATSSKSLMSSDDGGRTWRSQELPAGFELIDSVCWSAEACFVFDDGDTAYMTVDKAWTWMEATPPPAGEPGYRPMVDCVDDTLCIAFVRSNGALAYRSTDGASTWSLVAESLDSDNGGAFSYRSRPRFVECFSTGQCALVGTITETFSVPGDIQIYDEGFVWISNDANTWTNRERFEELVDIACVRVDLCVGNAGIASRPIFYRDDVIGERGTWITRVAGRRINEWSGSLRSLECPTSDQCFGAVHYSGRGSTVLQISLSDDSEQAG